MASNSEKLLRVFEQIMCDVGDLRRKITEAPGIFALWNALEDGKDYIIRKMGSFSYSLRPLKREVDLPTRISLQALIQENASLRREIERHKQLPYRKVVHGVVKEAVEAIGWPDEDTYRVIVDGNYIKGNRFTTADKATRALIERWRERGLIEEGTPPVVDGVFNDPTGNYDFIIDGVSQNAVMTKHGARQCLMAHYIETGVKPPAFTKTPKPVVWVKAVGYRHVSGYEELYACCSSKGKNWVHDITGLMPIRAWKDIPGIEVREWKPTTCSVCGQEVEHIDWGRAGAHKPLPGETCPECGREVKP